MQGLLRICLLTCGLSLSRNGDRSDKERKEWKLIEFVTGNGKVCEFHKSEHVCFGEVSCEIHEFLVRKHK